MYLSRQKGINIDELKDAIYAKAREIHSQRFPYNDFLYQKYDDLELPAPETSATSDTSETPQ